MARILLVDDDAVLLEVMALLLQRQGHQVFTVRGGEAALQSAAAAAFDLIVSDVMMPGLDGYQLAQRLRAAPATCQVPILLLTSSVRGPDAELAAAAGVDAVAVKTVSSEWLTQAVTAALAARRPAPEAPAVPGDQA